MPTVPQHLRRPRGKKLPCPHCHRRLAPHAFGRGSAVCTKCVRKEGREAARARADQRADQALTIRLGAARVLRIAQLHDVLELVQGYRIARPIEAAVAPLARVHIPVRRLPALLKGLSRFAPL